MDGWIKLHRKMLENPIVCKDSDYMSVWIYLLLNATHKEYSVMFAGKKIALKPGQLITGRKSISEKLNISESKVQRILKCFEIEQQIEQQNSNKNRLISILSWDEYQADEQQNEQRVNNKRTTTEQQVNTNKNVKNVKNEKNNSSSDIGEIDPLFGQAFEMMQQQFHFMNAIQQDEISHYLNNGMELGVLEEAIRKTKLGGNNLNYLFGILKKCDEQGVKTLAQYKEREAQHKREKEFKQQRQQRRSYQKPVKPAIPVVKNEQQPQVSQDDLDKALEMARRLDASRKKREEHPT